MKSRIGSHGWVLAAIALPALMLAAGCHSYHVETTVENRTGRTIQLLEVEYPSASFGADSLAADEDFHYRIQLRGSGPIKCYTRPATAAGRSVRHKFKDPRSPSGRRAGWRLCCCPEARPSFIPS